MSRERQIYLGTGVAALVLGAIFLAVFIAQRQSAEQQARTLAQKDAASDTDFLLEGRSVRIVVEADPQQLNLGDSLSFVMRLRDLPTTSQERATLGNVHDGSLLPALSAPAGCEVTPTQQRAIPSNQDLPLYKWAWVISCTSAGEKTAEASLSFQPNSQPNDSALLEYQSLTKFAARNPLSQQLLAALTIVSALVGVIAGIKGLVTRKAAPSDKA